MPRNSGRFTFDGGAATYVGTGILAFLVTVFTLGICYPFALVLRERWKAKHSFIDGQRLVFTGSAWGLFGHWIKWLLLSVITLGIYLFWVGPRISRWKWQNTDFAAFDTRPVAAGPAASIDAPPAAPAVADPPDPPAYTQPTDTPLGSTDPDQR